MSIQTINPTTGKPIAIYEECSSEAVNTMIDEMYSDYLSWSKQTISARALPMQRLAELLLDEKHECALLMAKEMGKPMTAGIAEVEKCAKLCRYYAENADTFLQARLVQTEYQKSYVCYQSLGIIFAIMPWNFPMWQVFRFAVPNLMVGNACLLKHAPISTGMALKIEQLIRAAKFPDSIFRSLVISVDQAANVITHKKIKGVTLTGSERAGKVVAAIAGSALKKSVLEMGGSDPYIILEDANLEQAAKICVVSRMSNTGQVCIAAKRLITVGRIHARFVELLQKEVRKIIVGDPLDSKTTMGPLARIDLRDILQQQVQQSITQGATLLCGGEIPAGDGFYYPPTILTGIQPGMAAYEEELFGPVACVIHVETEIDAIRIANDTHFGLGAAIFTQDVEKGERIAREELQAGTCNVNTMVTSDPRLPFGGIKQSGYGRELSIEGIHEFVNIKTIAIGAIK